MLHVQINSSKDSFNPITLRKTKIAYNFGLSECNRVKECCLIVQVLSCNHCFNRILDLRNSWLSVLIVIDYYFDMFMIVFNQIAIGV